MTTTLLLIIIFLLLLSIAPNWREIVLYSHVFDIAIEILTVPFKVFCWLGSRLFGSKTAEVDAHVLEYITMCHRHGFNSLETKRVLDKYGQDPVFCTKVYAFIKLVEKTSK